LVSLGAVLVFGLTPALQASKSGVAGVLKGDDRESGMRVGGSRFLNGIVVGVVALSFVTLFLAGALGASLSYVRNLDPGFAKEGRVLATVDFGLAGYSAAEAETIHDELLETVRAIPGVTTAALSGPVSMGDFSSSTGVYAADREYALDDLGVYTWYTSATAGWLETAGLRLLSGRWFTSGDEADAPEVVVINEALANIYWQGQDPVGRQIRTSRSPAGVSYTVVGVVETAKYMSMVEQPLPAVYFSMPQRPRPVTVLMASASGDPGALITPIRDAIREFNPSITPFDMKTMTQHVRNANWLYRLGAELGLVIGLLSTALAAGGLYGIMAFRVGRRRREMGIRIALGARGTRVLRHVLAGSMRLVVFGVLIGAAVATAASGIVQTVVFGVEAGSVLRLLAVGASLIALALAATVAPAMKAMRVDPVQAIRAE
jgi:predicted permease